MRNMYFHNKVQIYLNITFQITYRNSYAPKYTDGQIAFSFQLETYIKFIHKYYIITNHNNNNNKILFPLPNMMKFKVFFLFKSENYAPHSPLFSWIRLVFLLSFSHCCFCCSCCVRCMNTVKWCWTRDNQIYNLNSQFQIVIFSTDIVCFVSNKKDIIWK